MFSFSRNADRERAAALLAAIDRSQALIEFDLDGTIRTANANFLKLLAANRRLFAVADVIRAYRALVAKFKGEATADVTVAENLSDKNLQALKAALGN